MQNPKKSLLKNSDAYIPFAVIGIFIVLGATLTSVYFIKMDYEIAQIIYNTNHSNPKQTAVNLAVSDLSRCLNYAGMEALQWKGEHPIIQPDGTHIEKTSKDRYIITSDIHDVEPGDTLHLTIDLPYDPWHNIAHTFNNNITVTIYDSHNTSLATFSQPGETTTKTPFTIPQGAKPGFGRIELTCDTGLKATDWFNIGPVVVKEIAADHLNKLIAINYQDNRHTYNQYAINVEPDIKPEQITIEKVDGTLEREINPTNTSYTIYYTYTIKDLNYTLVDITTGETINNTMCISTLITSREPIIAELVSEYETSLNSGKTSNIVLGATNIRTFLYGPWQHYANGPANILTNPALSCAINTGVTYTQKQVFDSVDPWALIYTIYYNGKVLYQDVRGDPGPYDTNLTTIDKKLAANYSFGIDVKDGVSKSMTDSGTTLAQVSDQSKITVAAPDYTPAVLDGWVFDDRKWPDANPDLLHDITNSTYQADVQAQVERDGFNSIIQSDPVITANQGSMSHGGHSVSWDCSYATDGTHTGALVQSYNWSDSATNSYSKPVTPSINPPRGSVLSWGITSASISLTSVDAANAKTRPIYEYAGNDILTGMQRTDGYLDREMHEFDWEIRYDTSYDVKTRWDIDYGYTYIYRWRTFEGWEDPVNKTGAIYSTHYGTGSGSSSTSVSKTDSESLSHTEVELEKLKIIYHKRPPIGGYSGLDTYSDLIMREYRETNFSVNGVDRFDPCCSDAADKYYALHVDVYEIESDYSRYHDKVYLTQHRVRCDVPDWLHRVMADEVLEMIDAVDLDNPHVNVSLVDNLGADPTQLQAGAANELATDLGFAREGYVNKSKHKDGSALFTSSDAARFVGKNEAYNRLIDDITRINAKLEGDLDSHVLKRMEEKGIDTGMFKKSASESVFFNNPALEMAGTALGAEMGIMSTMTVYGMPENKYNWTENMTLRIDQYPDYLYHDENFDVMEHYRLVDDFTHKTVYPLGVRNTCVFSSDLAGEIADVINDSGDLVKTATTQMMSRSISDLSTEIKALESNLSGSFDMGLLDSNLDNLKQVYSSQMKSRIPDEVVRQVSHDPVVSGWIRSDEVRYITSEYLGSLSNEEIIEMSSDDNLSDDISKVIRSYISGANRTDLSEDEMDAVMHRVDTDVRIGMAEGISVVIIDNSKVIDTCFEGINNELQGMLDDATDKVTGKVNEKVNKQVSKRIEKAMKQVPSGLPVIPPHWAFTVNVWTYDVIGKYQYFKVTDNDNEVIYDSFYGHVGQTYMREYEPVFHPFKKDAGGFELLLGYNKPILFKFDGYAATIVGPGPKGVGDKVGGMTEISEGYEALIAEYGG
ncbi:MAG TPA: hypothetical protein C5S50_03185 [Methanosarcinaceae archaeon]|nr:hypothetical protein [Methanosarcinaceae archaeon]